MAKDSEYIDLRELKSYTPQWENGKIRMVYGYPVRMPEEPADEDCVNFGLKRNDQIFRRTLIPDDLKFWNQEEKEAFIREEYHRRKNGLWYLIDGEKLYVTGVFYFFLNYWHLQTGKKALFRITDLDFFHIWMYVVKNPKVYGLVVFKCRRIGDTEKSLCIVYEYATRVKNTLNGMQDCRNKEEMEKSYKRLIFAHNKMIWYMKPVHRGSNVAQEKLELQYPDTRESMAKIQKKQSGNSEDEIEFEFEAIGSTIEYYVSAPSATDGKRHGRYYCDEFGKPKTLDPIAGWKYTKKTVVDEIYEELIGKCLYTSTIEEEEGVKAKDSSRYLAIAREMWDDANPENLNENGETTSGMIRIVRGALERARPDRFGKTDKEAIRKKIKLEQDHLIKNKKWKKLIEHRRQNCIDINDVFATMAGDSSFNVDNLSNRENRLIYEEGLNKAVRGNFEWIDGKKYGDVYWNPTENGRYLVSGHPSDWRLKSNAKSEFALHPKPKNIHAFCAGIDPVSQKDVLDTQPSKGALVIKRKFDPMIDGDKFDEKGLPLEGGEHFKTNRIVCTLLWRHEEPTDNYEDWLKALIYYGSDFLIEKNHSAGFQTYMELNNFDGYYMENRLGIKNASGQAESWGISANEKSIEYYFGLILTITNLWCNTIDHVDVIDQLKSMNYENRGKRDLGVAMGICEVAAQRELAAPRDREKEAQVTHWEEYTV